MAFDYFLKIDGISGESKKQGHQGEIELQSWSFGVSAGAVGVTGTGGGGAGKATVHDFQFRAASGVQSPHLFVSAASGALHKTALLSGSDASALPGRSGDGPAARRGKP